MAKLLKHRKLIEVLENVSFDFEINILYIHLANLNSPIKKTLVTSMYVIGGCLISKGQLAVVNNLTFMENVF